MIAPFSETLLELFYLLCPSNIKIVLFRRRDEEGSIGERELKSKREGCYPE